MLLPLFPFLLLFFFLSPVLGYVSSLLFTNLNLKFNFVVTQKLTKRVISVSKPEKHMGFVLMCRCWTILISSESWWKITYWRLGKAYLVWFRMKTHQQTDSSQKLSITQSQALSRKQCLTWSSGEASGCCPFPKTVGPFNGLGWFSSRTVSTVVTVTMKCLESGNCLLKYE